MRMVLESRVTALLQTFPYTSAQAASFRCRLFVRARTVLLLFVAVTAMVLSGPVICAAQDEETEVYWNEDPPPDTLMSSGQAWHTWSGNKTIYCTGRVSTTAGRYVWMTLKVIKDDSQVITSTSGTAWKVVQRTLSYDPLHSSPGQYRCEIDSAGGTRNVTAVSQRYWGNYSRYTWGYENIDYVASNCDHPGMYLWILMTNPAPGWPNVGNPPNFAGDEGYRYYGVGVPGYNMSFMIPRGEAGPCVAPM